MLKMVVGLLDDFLGSEKFRKLFKKCLKQIYKLLNRFLCKSCSNVL